MIEGAIRYLAELAQEAATKQVVACRGEEYVVDADGRFQNPPDAKVWRRHCLQVHTLAGFVAAAKAIPGGEVAVVDLEQVVLFGAEDTERLDRTGLVVANMLKPTGEGLGQFMGVESFMIRAQAMLEPGPERDRLLKTVGTVDASAGMRVADDGVSQEVAIRSGVKSGWSDVKNPFTLEPFRTWSELEQPASEFVLRLRGGEGKPIEACLFDVFPGAWRTEAIRLAVEYIEAGLGKDSPIKVIG